MKSRIPYLVAALVAAAAIPHTLAQAPADEPLADAPTVPYVPAWIPKTQASADPSQFVAEPAASVSSSAGLEGELAVSIAESINADAAMKGAKITVQPDASDHKIYLTGVALNRQQLLRAAEIAANHAGGGSMVVNAIVDAQT